jgi:hypothetical protein
LFFIRIFGWSIAVTVIGLAVALILGGPTVFLLVLILGILEVSFSFDNAVINATVLRRMSKFWQTLFLTVGIAIAVFGMRLLFPLIMVTFTAGITPLESLDLAINNSEEYKHLLEVAHPAIAAFGGVFLLMIFLDFVFEDREIKWLKPIETALAKIGKLDQLSVVLTLGVLALSAETLAPNKETVLLAGVLGLITYLLVNGLGELFETSGVAEAEAIEETDAAAARPAAEQHITPARANGKLALATGKAAFFLFLYLEVLDASFSFDGVIGAFAITSDPFIIALGLGIGAMYVRSITVYLVRRGTLEQYVYLEHGAHWAIGALAVILFLTMKYHIHEVVTGLIGVVFIAASVFSSVRRRRKIRRGEPVDGERPSPELAQV